MNISIVGRHFELTDPIKEHIEGLFYSLEKYNLEMIALQCEVRGDWVKIKEGWAYLKLLTPLP